MHRSPFCPHPTRVQRLRFVIPGDPIGKPRMTRSDRWNERPTVLRYRSWADNCRAVVTKNPWKKLEAEVIAVHARAWFAMPASWSKTRRAELAGRPHRAKPDSDNCLKALMDSLLARDEQVASARLTKRWCREGESPRVELTLVLG